MRKTFLLSLGVMLAASALSARAITITINENSATRLDFELLWGVTQGPDSSLGPVSSNDFGSGVMADVGGAWPDFFILRFAPGTRALGPGYELFDFEGSQFLAIPGEPNGARFVYGEPLPPLGVPDGGTTAGLLGLGIAGLAFARRKVA